MRARRMVSRLRAQSRRMITPGVSRPWRLLRKTTLKSGMASEKPTGTPSFSAKVMRSATMTGLNCSARWSISWSVMGTKPQFFSQARL